jgi:NAD(P)-dependent dehydrogenase (short-subunit alcohol dehydrogenase family)
MNGRCKIILSILRSLKVRFKEKVAIVTGGGGGIGREISLTLAGEGARVIVADLDLAAANATVQEIADSARGSGIAVKTDVTDRESTRAMAKQAAEWGGRIDILVNNAGTDIKGAIWELEQETWDFLMELNLRGVFLCTQAVVKYMMEQKYGRIVNISSMAGKSGEAFTSPYCATKFGVLGFTQSIAMELGEHNITVNAVCPGAVETELIKKSITQTAAVNNRTYDEELYEKFLRLTPMGRIAKPKDVALAVAFLASDDASYITGTSLNVSGGRIMH